MRTTQTQWVTFMACPKKMELRYLDGLAPLEKASTLRFGSLYHDLLERWHRDRDLPAVLDHLDQELPNRSFDAEVKKTWHIARAMITAYTRRYPTEEFEVIALEKEFEVPIINPMTGCPSRTFSLAGKVDGIVRIDGEYWILEHKTAASIDASYLDRLWTDFQVACYSEAIPRALGFPITGTLYSISRKPTLKQGSGETEEEFEARRAELISKSKTGKTSAKRRLPETDDEFQERLLEKLTDPGAFHREHLYLTVDRIEEHRHHLWTLTKAAIEARRTKRFYRNPGACFAYHRPCEYFALCSSGDNPVTRQTLYEIRAPHEELAGEADPVEEAEPVF